MSSTPPSTPPSSETSARRHRRDRIRRKSLALAAGTVAALGVAAAAAPAAFAAQPVNYYVAPNGTDTSGSCTANSPSNAFPTVQDGVACAAAGDVVVLAPTNGTPYPGAGTVSQNITIAGQGARGTVIDVSSDALTVAAGAQVIVSGVSLSYPANAVVGLQPNVINNGDLTLRGDMVTGNPWAPGIFNKGTSTVYADLLLDDTTVEGNNDLNYVQTGGDGGGITQLLGNLTVENSTIADNTALVNGGGIFLAPGTATLINSTVADNQAISGGPGGIGGLQGRFVLSNTLIAGNTSTSGSTTVASDCEGTLVDGPGGGNLIGSLNSGVLVGQHCSGLTNGVNGDQIGVANPGVASAAAANGGQTDTVALLAGSPAIGAANAPTCETTAIGDLDQRGDARNALTRNACDVGAYDTGGN